MKDQSSQDRILQKLPELGPLLTWFTQNRRDFNWRLSNEPYRVWISEVMSQQTRAATIAAYFDRFMARFPTVADLAAAEEVDVLKLWEGLGYYSRARNIQKAARIIVDEYSGALPPSVEELRKLPGIGAYTAGAIASFCFGIAEPAVDGNAVRIVSRLLNLDFTQGDVKDRKTTHIIMEAYMRAKPEQDPGLINESFMTLGATVCIPRRPRCASCPLASVCLARAAGREAALPYKKTARPLPAERITYLIVERHDKLYLVERRPEGLLHGLWQFPCMEGHYGEDELRLRLDDMDLVVDKIVYLGERRHIFSHLVWELEIWSVRLKNDARTLPDLTIAEAMEPYLLGERGMLKRWVTAEEAEDLPFSAALGSFLPWRDKL